MSEGALAGLRVLDLTTLFAAPQIGAMLADLGADVVKIEPPGGDPIRRIGAQRNGHSLQWALLSRNKRAITLDLDGPDGRELFSKLVARADVLVENLPQRVAERWHCTWPELSARNPRLVVVSVSGFGATGPLAGSPGAGTIAEAFGGLTHMTGEADGPPLLASVPLGDNLSALAGVIGTLAACYHRDAGSRSGRGQHVDVSMVEPVLGMLGSTLVTWRPGEPPPHRTGSGIPGGVPRNAYRTRDDRWLALSATTDAQADRLLTLLGIDATAERERFATNEPRLANADELDGLVAGWIAQRTREAALAAFSDARLPAAAIHDLADILADPHLTARGSITRLADPDLGEVLLPTPSPRLSATPAEIRSTGPALGAHTQQVLVEWLELAPGEAAKLASAEAN